MKPLPSILIACLVLLAFAGGWIVGGQYADWTSQPAKEPPPPHPGLKKVVAQGRIIPRGGTINIIATPGRRVETIPVQEGSSVESGVTELVTFRGQEQIRAQTELSEARADEAVRELESRIVAAQGSANAAAESMKLAELELATVQQADPLAGLESQIDAAREKLDRFRVLAADPLTRLYVSDSQLADQERAIEEAERQRDSARRQHAASIEAAITKVEMARQAKDDADKVLQLLRETRDQNRTAKLTRELADQQREESRLIAPIDGTVLKIFAKPGEVVTQTPLMQIGDLSQIECVAEVVDRLIPEVRRGQSVTILSPALPRPLRGRVIEIGRIVGPGTLADPSPLALVDRKTVEVRVLIEPDDAEAARQLIHLQVSVEIETESPIATGTPERPPFESDPSRQVPTDE